MADTLEFITVSAQQEGMRLKDALTDKLLELPSSVILKLLREGRVQVDGRGADGGTILRVGQRIEMRPLTEPHLVIRARPLDGFEVLYEDAAALVCAKPAGVGVTAGRGELEAPFLGACLHHLSSSEAAAPCRPRVVHRLDRDTSGAVIIAKSREALRHLAGQFEEGTVEKRYAALVVGVPHRSEGVIDLPIGTEAGGKLRAGGKDARPASTRFEIEERFRGYALMGVTPLTGRTHQIRVHLESIGHPLVVDPLYGAQSTFLLSSFKRAYVPNRRNKERPLMARLALHAQRLSFDSPVTGQRVEVEAPYPKDLRVTLKQLRRWAASREG